MGSGRGDRNQVADSEAALRTTLLLQWGPVVVTGISGSSGAGSIILTRFNGVRSW